MSKILAYIWGNTDVIYIHLNQCFSWRVSIRSCITDYFGRIHAKQITSWSADCYMNITHWWSNTNGILGFRNDIYIYLWIVDLNLREIRSSYCYLNTATSSTSEWWYTAYTRSNRYDIVERFRILNTIVRCYKITSLIGARTRTRWHLINRKILFSYDRLITTYV